MKLVERLFMRQGDSFPIQDLNSKNMAAGLVSGLLAIIGPPALILEAASNGDFTITQTIAWICSIYVFGGLFSIVFPLYYRIPIVGAHTITGVAFLTTVTPQFSYHELIGAYMLSGLLMLIVGFTGIFAKLIESIPKEVLAAMLAGMITKYLVAFVISLNQLVVIGSISLIAYFLLSKWSKKVPPMVGAIAVGFIVLTITTPLQLGEFNTSFFIPTVQKPEFSFLGFLSVSIPLALLILSNDVAVGLGALEQNKFRPPVNRLISYGGIFSMITSVFGGQSANVAGMMSAICSDDEAGPREKRYMGAVVSGSILLCFGIFSWKLVPFIQSLPPEFVSMLVGFALLGVFGNSLHVSFSNPSLKISATFAFIIALSNITILHMSAPVWSLIVGTILARYVERGRN